MSEVHNPKSENWCRKSTIWSLMYEIWRNLKFDVRRLSENCLNYVQSLKYSRSCHQRPCHQRPFVSNNLFSCTEHFSIVNDLWSTTFCLTRFATSNIWQKVIILLVSNDLTFFHHTTFGNINEQTTACQIWLSGYHGLTERYHARRSGCCRKRPICLRW